MKGQMLSTYLSVGVLAISSAATIDQNWESRFVLAPGLNDTAYAMVGIGTNLYVGGAFTTVGRTNTAGIARWDGTQWHSVGGGIKGIVLTLATDGTNLFAGGLFSLAGNTASTNLAKWDGTNWSSLGALHRPEEPDSNWAGVYSLLTDGTDLFAGGNFSSAGGISATNIARWDGTSWHPLGDGLGIIGGDAYPATVYDIALHGSNLFAAGVFINSGAVGVTNLARWTGALWEPCGSGVTGGIAYILWIGDNYEEYSGCVYALSSTPTGLLVGGDFTQAGNVTATNLARWDGTNWSATGTASSGWVRRIVRDETNSVVLGYFSRIGGIAASGAAQLSGDSWTALGLGVYPEAISAARIGTNLYIGGDFQVADEQSAGFVTRWDGAKMSPLLPGKSTAPSEMVSSMAYGPAGDLYVAGAFQTVGELRVNGVTRYDGTNWYALGNGFPERNVQSVVVVGTNVFINGYFARPANGITNLARWNGSDWVALGLGLGNDGYAPSINNLAAGVTNLFAAGYFKTAGGMPATNLARWDGNAWHSLNYQPSPYNSFTSSSTIDAITTQDDDLFICERTSTYVGAASFTLRVRHWQNGNWTQIGAAISFAESPYISPSMVWAGTNLYVTGRFVITDDFFATNIFRWNGNAWSGVSHPFGHDGLIFPAISDGKNLFIAINSYALPEVKLAKFDGTQWMVLGTGIASDGPWPSVHALAVRGRDLFVGGNFSSAGGKPADNLALWHDYPSVTLSSRGWQPNGHFGLRIHGGQGQPVQVQSSTNLHEWMNLGTQSPNSDDYNFEDATSTGASKRFYRLQLIP